MNYIKNEIQDMSFKKYEIFVRNVRGLRFKFYSRDGLKPEPGLLTLKWRYDVLAYIPTTSSKAP